MMQTEQQSAAKTFSENWRGKGDEKQETQRFWIGLLGEVLKVINPQNYIEFEKRVKRIGVVEPVESTDKGHFENLNDQHRNDVDGHFDRLNDRAHTNFIDAYIPETKVLIEQKGIKIDLNKAYEQSDGTMLTPFEQAKRYVNDMKASEKPRWIVVSNFAEFHVYDLENPQNKPEIIFLKDLEKDFYRLEFLVDRKNENIRREEEISIAAGHLVGKMYDALVKEYINPELPESARSLNILCVRLVFCFYAEDAGLFETRTSFEDYIKSFNLQNVRVGLIKLFKALDTKLEDRDKYDGSLKPFPYVNGGLFHDENIEIPNFTQEIVDVLVNDCALFNWSEISPTIFGAVFESTLNPETRRKGGMHYTSVQNIHKVIDPLFMDELNAEFDEIMGVKKSHSELLPDGRLVGRQVDSESAKEMLNQVQHDERNQVQHDGRNQVRRGTSLKNRSASLAAFQKKLGSLTFLDPACGSGNFLTETYLSLRRLENKVISLLNKGEKVLGFDEFIKVKISQFYGIEINDFAVTVAKTALWIAESQMINETEKIVSQEIDFLPLKTQANIVEGNALRMDWATFKNLDGSKTEQPMLFEFGGEQKNAVVEALETTRNEKGDFDRLNHQNHYDYIMGNPPFVGRRYRSESQQEEIASFFEYKDIDYVACWYYKAAELVQKSNTHCAFVSTNSITQGEQVAPLWKPLFDNFGTRIDFAYRTFRWDSESSLKAHVHCVIIGFSNKKSEEKTRFIIDEHGEKKAAVNINGYLLDAPNIFIEIRSNPLCDVPPMKNGNVPLDGDALKIEAKDYPKFKDCKWVKRLMGGQELLHNEDRYVLWLVGAAPNDIKADKRIYERVQLCRQKRLAMKDKGTQKLADTPTTFRDTNNPENYIALPMVSSEKRKYLPMAYLHGDVIPTNQIQTIPDATLYHFGVLESIVHMAWMRAVAGRLKSDYRYSKDIVYNNFPWCNPTDEQMSKIEDAAQAINDARANYPKSDLSELYDETLMPPDLRKAHEANDRAVMQAYGFDKNASESEIVAELFKMYEKLAKNQ